MARSDFVDYQTGWIRLDSILSHETAIGYRQSIGSQSPWMGHRLGSIPSQNFRLDLDFGLSRYPARRMSRVPNRGKNRCLGLYRNRSLGHDLGYVLNRYPARKMNLVPNRGKNRCLGFGRHHGMSQNGRIRH